MDDLQWLKEREDYQVRIRLLQEKLASLKTPDMVLVRREDLRWLLDVSGIHSGPNILRLKAALEEE